MMFSAGVWISGYAQLTADLAAWMNSEADQDIEARLEAVEALLQKRQDLLNELQNVTLSEEEKRICRAYVEDIQEADRLIIDGLQRIKSELGSGFKEIREKRAELNLHSKANRSYSGSAKSGEGYFIDRKK